MTPTEKFKRAEALFNDRTKRELADMVVHREADLEDAKAESEHMRLKYMAAMGELGEENDQLKAENAKLREQMERLVTLLRADCDIEASWDGLRKFWSIGLTEDGCLMRDRACKAEAENAKLRELAERAWKSAERLCQAFDGPCRDDGVTINKPCPMGERDEECIYGLLQRDLRELGVEVDG